MTEQKIEKILVDYLSEAVAAAGANIQVVGVLQPTVGEDVKGVEDGSAEGLLVVKAYPRQYETFTSVYCTVQLDVTLTVRSDADYNGRTYLDVTEGVVNALHRVQKSFQQFSQRFEIEGEWDAVGFRMDGGDCGLDKENCVWQYTQSVAVDGIIQN